jgi:hypothetical protein
LSRLHDEGTVGVLREKKISHSRDWRHLISPSLNTIGNHLLLLGFTHDAKVVAAGKHSSNQRHMLGVLRLGEPSLWLVCVRVCVRVRACVCVWVGVRGERAIPCL